MDKKLVAEKLDSLFRCVECIENKRPAAKEILADISKNLNDFRLFVRDISDFLELAK